jgi:hypothetical protein
MSILTFLKKMHSAQQKKGPWRGGSKLGRKKLKPRQRMEGHTMLHTDYFADDATYATIFGGAS